MAYRHLRLYQDESVPEDALALGAHEDYGEESLVFEALEKGQTPSIVTLNHASVVRLRDDLTLWLKGKLS